MIFHISAFPHAPILMEPNRQSSLPEVLLVLLQAQAVFQLKATFQPTMMLHLEAMFPHRTNALLQNQPLILE